MRLKRKKIKILKKTKSKLFSIVFAKVKSVYMHYS